MFQKIKIPLLLLLAIVIILAMLRLAVWQLDRAEQKQLLLDQVTERSEQAVIPIADMLSDFNGSELRYRNVSVTGHFRHQDSIYIDNQVVNGNVGYLVFTPFELNGANQSIMINRGWLPVGASREVLPQFTTPEGLLRLVGRLNKAPEQPPLWDDKYQVAQGAVWAYLPLDKYASQIELKLLPLVLELAPKTQDGGASLAEGSRLAEGSQSVEGSDFVIKWAEIDDQWVAKHQGYAFQWLMMAFAFFIACLVLLLRGRSRSVKTNK